MVAGRLAHCVVVNLTVGRTRCPCEDQRRCPSQAEPRGAQPGHRSRVDVAKSELQRVEQLRAKRLKKKEKMDRLTTGNYSIWQMSKCLGPRRSRKIGLEMQRVVEVGRGPVKSVFLVESQNYQARTRKQQAKKNREVLFNAQREYDLHVKNRKTFRRLKKEQKG